MVNNTDLTSQVGDVLFSAEQIQQRVEELGKRISADYKDECPLIVAVLKGSALFVADLLRQIDCCVEVDFLAVSSYGSSTKSSGVVRIVKDLETEVAGRDVLIVEDIIESGLTLNYLVNYLAVQKPASIRTCSLLLRDKGQHEEPPLDYYGFKVQEGFVIGYGLDLDQKYRNLPYIALYEPIEPS